MLKKEMFGAKSGEGYEQSAHNYGSESFARIITIDLLSFRSCLDFSFLSFWFS